MKEVSVGANRTGIAMSPMDKVGLIEAAEQASPSSSGSEESASRLRAEIGRGAGVLGSVPPPASVKGMMKAAAQVLQGRAPSVLIDRLGERLAFERTGSRLYEALLVKYDAAGGFDGGPSRGELEAFHGEEVRHFEMLRQAIERLGADPTAQTPAADVQGVTTGGLLQVVSDPRTNLDQALQALLAAELIDTDGWRMLVDLARAYEQHEMAIDFSVAEREEERHLQSCRRWVAAGAMREAREREIARPDTGKAA